jgi:hypothetical protein
MLSSRLVQDATRHDELAAPWNVPSPLFLGLRRPRCAIPLDQSQGSGPESMPEVRWAIHQISRFFAILPSSSFP